MEVVLLLYVFMACGIGLLGFLLPSARGRDRFARAFGSLGILSAVFVVLLWWNKAEEIGWMLFLFVWMAGGLAIAIRVSGPALRRGGLKGFLSFLGCGVVISLIVFHPWNHLVAGQSTSEHMGIRNRTLYTIWYIIVPVMLGSLLNPRASPRLSHGWKIFCYAYAFLSAAEVRVEQYLYYNVTYSNPLNLFLCRAHIFDWAPFTFPVTSVLAAFLIRWLARRSPRARKLNRGPKAEGPSR